MEATEPPCGAPKAPVFFLQLHPLLADEPGCHPGWSSELSGSGWKPKAVVWRHLVADSVPASLMTGISPPVTWGWMEQDYKRLELGLCIADREVGV